MTPEEALQAAIKIVGGCTALSRRLKGVSRQSVSQWTRCPKWHVIHVEAAVRAALAVRPKPISRYDLRPDLFPKKK